MVKDRLSHCLSLKTVEIVLEVLQRLSGRVIAAGKEILAPSSFLSPNHDRIRSLTQIWLSTATSHGDHGLEMNYVHLASLLTEIKSVYLVLINLLMSV